MDIPWWGWLAFGLIALWFVVLIAAIIVMAIQLFKDPYKR